MGGASSRKLLDDAESCAAGARVACDLRRVRTKRTPGNDTQARAVPADAGGEVGRTNAVARFAREELFDDPILERVKGDDRDPASGAEDAHRAFERHREVRELVIHRDAERLEDPRGRIDAPRTAGLHARDEAAELVSGPEGRLGAAAAARPGDPCGFGLFAVFGEDAAKVVPGPAVHDVGCSEAKVRVGTPIPRAPRAKT